MNAKRIFSWTVVAMLPIAVILALALSSGSAARGRSAATRRGPGLTTKRTGIGQILVDGRGRSLYLFEADKPNRSTLSAAGFKVWPAYVAAHRPPTGGGVSAPHISVIRSNGRTQLAYFGHPLYYFVGDQKPGDTTGQGLLEFGALWFVVSPNGTADTHSTSGSASESP
ncbi:MAG TPA: hypothetical protein VGH93_12870, partial [Solirubrobacteraceae bacterium]